MKNKILIVLITIAFAYQSNAKLNSIKNFDNDFGFSFGLKKNNFHDIKLYSTPKYPFLFKNFEFNFKELKSIDFHKDFNIKNNNTLNFLKLSDSISIKRKLFNNFSNAIILGDKSSILYLRNNLTDKKKNELSKVSKILTYVGIGLLSASAIIMIHTYTSFSSIYNYKENSRPIIQYFRIAVSLIVGMIPGIPGALLLSYGINISKITKK